MQLAVPGCTHFTLLGNTDDGGVSHRYTPLHSFFFFSSVTVKCGHSVGWMTDDPGEFHGGKDVVADWQDTTPTPSHSHCLLVTHTNPIMSCPVPFL